MLAILADIGGTNTRVALAEGTSVRPDSVARFSNAEYKARGQDIAQILAEYLHDAGVRVDGVCVAAAGPVQDGVATMTNLDWTMDEAMGFVVSGGTTAPARFRFRADGEAPPDPADRD